MWRTLDSFQGYSKKDIVLCPNGTGQYRVGEITGGYTYVPTSQTTSPLARPPPLDEHPARPATGVIDPSLVGFQHGDQ